MCIVKEMMVCPNPCTNNLYFLETASLKTCVNTLKPSASTVTKEILLLAQYRQHTSSEIHAEELGFQKTPNNMESQKRGWKLNLDSWLQVVNCYKQMHEEDFIDRCDEMLEAKSPRFMKKCNCRFTNQQAKIFQGFELR